MTLIKTNKIRKGLLKKGFLEERSHDHVIFRLYDEGKKTNIHTKISHGGSEYDDQLISLMARELNLKKDSFLKLIECPLKHEDYIKILKEDRILL
ncbi:hypothetical protein [Acidiplasma sp.]|uniref:hypothetical protein n=1 Tax=Acidiplasma sp. TaxID=1872114 RepID=UPI00258A8B08|nr:hypothetical protein [Acidiplasma sp.]